MESHWLSTAVTPPRACGAPLGQGALRTQPEDFVVEEDLGFAASGTGQHVLLKVRKRNANTQWVARELARLAGCHPRDVGYAGLKDRRAVAVQWLTVPKSTLTLEAWCEVRHPEFDVLEAHAHSRKLPRGALAGNRFTIRIRGLVVGDEAFDFRVARIKSQGVPNYFGPQRFGHNGSNLARIPAGLQNLRSPERGFVLSAARAVIFNAVLAARVQEGSWNHLEPGDIANLDGRGSIFPVEGIATPGVATTAPRDTTDSFARTGPTGAPGPAPAIDPSLVERAAQLDLHPTGPLWGRGAPATQHRIATLESRVAAQFQPACDLTTAAGMDQERRALRLAVRDFTWHREPDARVVSFRLTRGSFATTVLRELIDTDGPDDDSGE
jgi:tRNA pseudouridine13 synthase